MIWTALRDPAETDHPFAHVVSDDEWVFVTGVGGHDTQTGEIADDTAAQARQAIATVRQLLESAGSGLEEVVRLRPYVTDRRHAAPMDAVFRAELPDPKPAAGALVICQLIDPAMHMEIEVVARRGARLVAAS